MLRAISISSAKRRFVDQCALIHLSPLCVYLCVCVCVSVCVGGMYVESGYDSSNSRQLRKQAGEQLWLRK